MAARAKRDPTHAFLLSAVYPPRIIGSIAEDRKPRACTRSQAKPPEAHAEAANIFRIGKSRAKLRFAERLAEKIGGAERDIKSPTGFAAYSERKPADESPVPFNPFNLIEIAQSNE